MCVRSCDIELDPSPDILTRSGKVQYISTAEPASDPHQF